jgi:hypothetical protein
MLLLPQPAAMVVSTRLFGLRLLLGLLFLETLFIGPDKSAELGIIVFFAIQRVV